MSSLDVVLLTYEPQWGLFLLNNTVFVIDKKNVPQKIKNVKKRKKRDKNKKKRL